mgnify:CR=1 FL=1
MPRPAMWVVGHVYAHKYKPHLTRKIVSIDGKPGELSNDVRVVYENQWGQHECSLGAMRADWRPVAGPYARN